MIVITKKLQSVKEDKKRPSFHDKKLHNNKLSTICVNIKQIKYQL
jgi:hypothetical protein